jgi:ERF superfamily
MSEVDHACLAAALVAALAELTTIDTNHEANAGSYTYKYADIADVVKVTRPVLANHGVVALTPVHEHGDGLACTVTILHASGERLDFEPFPFPRGRDAQATGSMVTYHRRYALVAALGMAADDDDGAAAKEPRAEPPPNRRAGKPATKKDRDAIVAILNEIPAEATVEIAGRTVKARQAAKVEYLEHFGLGKADQLRADQVLDAVAWATERRDVLVPLVLFDGDSLMAGIRAYEERLGQEAWPGYTQWLTDQYGADVDLDKMDSGDLEQVWRYLHELVTVGIPTR